MIIKYLLCYLFINLIVYLGINAQSVYPPSYPTKHPKKLDRSSLPYQISPFNRFNPIPHQVDNDHPFSILLPKYQSWKKQLPHFQYFSATTYNHRQNFLGTQSFNQIKNTFAEHSKSSSFGVREAWVHIYESGLLASTDLVADMVVDSLGNTYVTGSSTHPPYGMDICTIKYDAKGNVLWQVYFDAGYQGYDEAWGIALDKHGNVIIIGKSDIPDPGSALFIIKLNSEGILQWKTQYKDKIYDQPYKLDIDSSGHILLGGMIWPEDDPVTDYLVLKYNAEGGLIWKVQYGGKEILDELTDLKSDQWGNVFVTGISHDWLTDFYFTHTLKYNTQGDLLWDKEIISGDHGWVSNFHFPKIVTDDSGYIYLTTTIGGNNRGDIFTIKYDHDGQIMWSQNYSASDDQAAQMLTLDLWGNIYVGGSTYDHGQSLLRNVILKYDPKGNLLWEYTEEPQIYGLTSDFEGNIYYIQQGNSLVKLDHDGKKQWQQAIEDTFFVSYPNKYPLLAIFPNNQIGISGTVFCQQTQEDFHTLNYENNGEKQWSVYFNGKKNEKSYPEFINLDKEGKIQVTGRSFVSGDYQNLVTLSYSPSGEILRELRYQGDFPRSSIYCKTIENNDLITACQVKPTNDYSMIRINRYDVEGKEKWEQNFRGEANYFIYHFDTDKSGNIYISGQEYADSIRYFSLKYNVDGQQQWMIWHSIRNDFRIEPFNSFGSDNTGNLYLISYSLSSFLILKYNPDGQLSWEEEIEYFNPYFYSLKFIIPQSDYIYLTDYSLIQNLLYVFKLNKHGQIEWITRDNVPSFGSYYYVSDIIIDENENICITGACYSESRQDIFTIKYNKNGQRLWINTLQEDFQTEGDFLLTDHKENIYTFGLKYTVQNHYDIIIIKYDSEGKERWMITYGGTNIRSSDGIENAVLDKQGNIYITSGSDLGSSYYSHFITTIKISQTGEDILSLPEELTILPNTPNPFNYQTLLRYELPQAGQVRLTIFNVLGKKTMEKELGYQDIGNQIYQFTASQLASGIYYYRIQVGNLSETAKMVLLK